MTFTGLKRRLNALAFIDEFGPVYAVYTLWFNDNGISTAEISTAFIVWAVFALVLEIPSGALADRMDRRQLLATAFGIRAAGISIWLLWPTFSGVIVGACLWAAHDAAASGTWEAMIHDELTAVEHADDYQPVMARIGQFSHLGVAAGTLLGGLLLRVDVALVALGWITVATHIGSISGVLLLPDARWVSDDVAPVDHAGGEVSIGTGPVAGPVLDDVAVGSTVGESEGRPFHDWWATLRQGVDDARHSPVLLKLVVVGAMIEGLYILDEYVPLLSRARGGDDSAAPIIVFVVWIGLLTGGEVAARWTDLRSRTVGLVMIAGIAVTTVAFVTTSVWALMLIAVGYGTMETARITTDARLQERTPAATRATVTSVRGFGGATVSMLAFVVIGAMSDGDDPTPGHFVIIAALLATGVLVIRWVPSREANAKRDGMSV